MSVNSRLKAIQIIGQRKAFYRQRIPESTCVRYETAGIDIFVTYRNGDRKIMQSIRIKSRPPSNNTSFQNNTYRKDFSWLYFDNEPRIQDRQQVKDQQSCISIFVAYATISSSNQEHQPRHVNSIPYIAVWQIYRDTATSGKRNFIERIKAPIFSEAVLAAEIM